MSQPTPQIAQIVRANGPKVCVFPINGTRRWFILEHGQQSGENSFAEYIAVSEQRHLELYQMIFDHGVENLLTPIFGPDLLERGPEYMELAANGLVELCRKPALLAFYDQYEVRVRFYGDHRKYFGPTPYAYLSDLFDDLTARTAHHERHKLFFGVFAHDAAETTGELAVQYYLEHGKTPDKRALVEMYYGEYVPPVDIFIGFDKFCAFDMPLIATGSEDLYFTVSPSPYLNEPQLRAILYDHLFNRRDSEPDYSSLPADEWNIMRSFYRQNIGGTCGLGVKRKPAGYWYPLPQVLLPREFDDASS
ncbi:MAG: diterpene synthase [Chloroflexi bacterium]|nr:diterpene synthase [Chloroflexota bacterium]